MLLIFSGLDSSKWKVKAGSFNSPVTKGSEIANPREKVPDEDQKKKSVFMAMPTCGGQLWGLSVLTVGTWYLQQTGFNVTDVGLNSQRAFLLKKGLFDKISQLSKCPKLN